MSRRAIGDGSIIDVDVEVDPRDAQIEGLKAENRRLQRAVSDAEVRAERAREDADRALSNLRRQLSPLYRAMQMVFGELDSAGVVDGPAPTAAPHSPAFGPDARIQAIWENWKSKMPGYPARIIEALLIQSDLNTAQLAIACGCKPQRISEGIVKLNKASLINKNGHRFSLKQV